MNTPDPESSRSEYDRMLGDLQNAIDEVNHKIENGRIRKPEHDKTRIRYYKCLGYLVRSQLKVIEQRDLQEMKERLEALEERRGSEDYKVRP